MARYIDTGARQSRDALGSWLGQELMGSASPIALRVQTGFFGSGSLGFFESALSQLELADGHTRFLIGSNDGVTTKKSVADLIKLAGKPRNGMRLGVVSYQGGLFHPKVYHFERADGSATAYVGSANLTEPGVRSAHVEAGIILDTVRGDSEFELQSIADAIDEWFKDQRNGLYEVASESDLEDLVKAHILGVNPPAAVNRVIASAQRGRKARGSKLRPLIGVPPIQSVNVDDTSGQGAHSQVGIDSPSVNGGVDRPSGEVPPSLASSRGEVVKHWGKKLSASDAQRKAKGNERGAITLVQGDYRGKIDQTTYFRTDLFGGQEWQPDLSRTGQTVDRAIVPMNVIIDGISHGVMDFLVTNGTSRQASQNNYTAELHVEPIRQIIAQLDVTGRQLEIVLDNDGKYWLTIE
ncbi:phospholipase D family protein [Corynebacterium sp. NPDC060344]|uniref:phospholipase D family protein n=1 Tax=Corynebacterium sp. NPDC060344 TaxID=3347101 RepID=UPI00365C4E12